MVDWDGLENRCAFTGTVGSNPTLSAIHRLLSAPVEQSDQETGRAAARAIGALSPWGWRHSLELGAQSQPDRARGDRDDVRPLPAAAAFRKARQLRSLVPKILDEQLDAIIRKIDAQRRIAGGVLLQPAQLSGRIDDVAGARFVDRSADVGRSVQPVRRACGSLRRRTGLPSGAAATAARPHPAGGREARPPPQRAEADNARRSL